MGGKNFKKVATEYVDTNLLFIAVTWEISQSTRFYSRTTPSAFKFFAKIRLLYKSRVLYAKQPGISPSQALHEMSFLRFGFVQRDRSPNLTLPASSRGIAGRNPPVDRWLCIAQRNYESKKFMTTRTETVKGRKGFRVRMCVC